MNSYFFCFILLFVSGLNACQTVKTENTNDEIIIIAQKENKKYNLTATFYGVNFKFEDKDNTVKKIITHVILRDNQDKKEIKYAPAGGSKSGANGTDGITTPDFYFLNIWSPNEEYLVLPLGKFEGFAIFEAKTSIADIGANKYFDTIKVQSVNSGFYWHDFEKWEDKATFNFRAGLQGDMFAFKYNVEKAELYCFQEKCEETQTGFNKKGRVKAFKKGNIETIKKTD